MNSYVPLLPTDTWLTMRGTRLQNRFRSLAAVVDTFSISAAVLRGETPDLVPLRPSLLRGRCEFGIVVPRITTFRMALQGQDPGDVAIQITRDISEWPGAYQESFGGVRSLLDYAGTAQFILYYESYVDWVRAKADNSIAKLNPVWGFARVVRNAISHGGSVSIKDPSFSPVSWAHLTYGPDDHRGLIIGSDLEMPDLMLLMLDMDVTLERMGFDAAQVPE